jgi:hypothetical protein
MPRGFFTGRHIRLILDVHPMRSVLHDPNPGTGIGILGAVRQWKNVHISSSDLEI